MNDEKNMKERPSHPNFTEKADAEPVHHRRKRYSGTHPRKFEEKYKEHDPEKYADTIAHVIEKGNTPAGMHIPIMVDEILDILRIQPGMKGLDCTLGYGGHSRKMMEKLREGGENPESHLYALDVDPIESVKTRERLAQAGFGEEILTVIQENFANIDQISEKYGPFDFVLADLGVSSMQIDDPKRGFSYKMEGPLDLRLNPEVGISAAERLHRIREDELAGMLIENADEPYADVIAKAVVKRNRKGPRIATTTDLADCIAQALSFLPKGEQKEAIKKSCQRTFQALRIDINHEYEVLYAFLDKLPGILKKGGRAAILTFHSGEDRLVKKAFKTSLADGTYSETSKDVIRPSAQECRRNPRAHSTKLRWAVKE